MSSILLITIVTIIGYVVLYYFYSKYLKETNNEKLFKPWEKIIHLIVAGFLAGIVSSILTHFLMLGLLGPSEIKVKSVQSGIHTLSEIIGLILMYVFLWLILKYRGIDSKIASKIASSTVGSTFITFLIGGMIVGSLIVFIFSSLLSYPKI